MIRNYDTNAMINIRFGYARTKLIIEIKKKDNNSTYVG